MDNMTLFDMFCMAIAVSASIIIWFGLKMAKAIGHSNYVPVGGYEGRGRYGYGNRRDYGLITTVVISLVILGAVALVYNTKENPGIPEETISREDDYAKNEYRISDDTVPPMSYYEEPEAYPRDEPPVRSLEENPAFNQYNDENPNEYSDTEGDVRLNVSPSGRNSNLDNGNEVLIRFNDNDVSQQPPEEPEGNFYLQKGAAATEEEAIDNQQQLEKQYPGKVHIGHDKTESYLAYKILLGPFASKKEALDVKKSKGEWVRNLETDDTIEVIH